MAPDVSKKSVKIIVAAVAAAIIAGGAFYLGNYLGRMTPNEVVIKGVTNIGDDDAKADFGIFWQAWKAIKENFFYEDREPEERDMLYGAAKGLAESLNDPNTVFFPPADAQKFEEDIAGAFGGIGAEIGNKNGAVVVIAPLKGSPAERAGLRPKDVIRQVDETALDGMAVNDAVKIIRGPIGTTVTLHIVREGWDEPKEFDIIREEIRVPVVEIEMIGPQKDLALLKVFSFNQNAAALFAQAAMLATANNSRGMILDLRNNPGGYLESAVAIAGWFFERGELVVSERFRSGAERMFRASGNELLKDVPLVVIVNGGSASASEILAGALRDNRGVKLVGEKTFGKGSVQELLDFADGSSLKLTTARWFTPKGSAIEKNGLAPDYEVKFTEEDATAERDPQLEKAIEVLKTVIR